MPGRNGPVTALIAAGYHDEFARTSLTQIRSSGVTSIPVCEYIRTAPAANDCLGTGSFAGSPAAEAVAVLTLDRSQSPPFVWTDPNPTLRLWSDGSWRLSALPKAPPGSDAYSYDSVRWMPGAASLIVGRSLVSSSTGSRPDGLLEVTLDGVAQRRLIDGETVDPDVSGTGRIAFIRHGNLFVTQPEGGLRALTWRGASTPSWAPSGTRIAFARGCGPYGPTPTCRIYTVPAKGGKARLEVRGGYLPSWSPDGTQIAFMRELPSRDPAGLNGYWPMAIRLADGKQRRLSSEPIDDEESVKDVRQLEWLGKPGGGGL